MRRVFAWMICAAMALGLSGCAASNASYYEQAQLYLGSGDFDTAATLFSQLGEYEDSAEYALYCAALDALQNGDRTLAAANLHQISPFKSSERYLQLIDAARLEDAGDLEGALEAYAALGSFEDSQQQAKRLRAAIPERDMLHAKALMSAGRFEQARTILMQLDGYPGCAELLTACDAGITKAAYEQAEALYAKGSYGEALAAFEAMGDTLDAKARALMCRGAMYRQLESEYAAATLRTAADLMDRYAEMENYLDSADRLAELKNRYAVNLRLLRAASARPYVYFGRYPTEESGEEDALLWRVTAADEDSALLLCEQVIDAMPVASMTDLCLTLTPEESAAASAPALPQRSDLHGLDEAALACHATPYAMAQEVRRHQDGRAWWWLADELPGGRRPIVWYNGRIIDSGVEPEEPTVGVRPLLRVSLEKYAFTQGSGTREDPFR